jgi:uncharacterized protein YqgV (UPF0045/DUF77 family)/GTPase SAR1 family protein
MNTPKFIDIQEALRRNGPVVENQIIKTSDYVMTFSNNIRTIWTHCALKLELDSYKNMNSNVIDPDLEKYFSDIRNSISKEINSRKKSAKLEGLARNEGANILLKALLHSGDVNSSSLTTKVLSAVELFLEWNTALRWASNLKRHYDEAGYELSDNEIEEILRFFNQTNFDIVLPKIAAGSCIAFALIELDFEADDTTFEGKCDEIFDRIERVCNTFEDSSLKIYEKRLNNLEWGPQNYHRDRSFIRAAHTALNDNKIIAFYGLGGVGKTALAQKLMFDIINNREPYTHLVTHSSKVGSDQKEINTIAPQTTGSRIETNQQNSVMESSLIPMGGLRMIGGLRMLLKKIYKETTANSGELFSDAQLQRRVFQELQKDENQVLIVIDNYEDIEDNQDDPDVLQIKDEIKVFLEDFSQLSNTKSRIIITTRSSPLDVAYGLQVKHLTKTESAELFLEKIRFRSLRSDTSGGNNALPKIHQLFSQDLELKDELIRSFDLWDTDDVYIAHPLLVLLAAEEVEQDDKVHIIDIIQSWGDGRKASDVIEYCVSKTLGSFKPHEIELLKFLTQMSNLNTEISIKLLLEVIEKNISNEDSSPAPANTIHDNLRKISDSDLIDVMHRLSDRTFFRVVSKRSIIGGTCWSWNKIVYEYLKNQRFESNKTQPMSETKSPTDLTLIEFPAFFEPIEQWNKMKPGPISMAELVTPLEKSINLMVSDIVNRIDGQDISYELSSLEYNLEKQTYHLVILLQKIEEYLKTDISLVSLRHKTSNKEIKDIINPLLRLLGRQARCWRSLAAVADSKFAPQICLKFAVQLLNRVSRHCKQIYSAKILNEKQYLNLLRNVGRVHIDILDMNIEMNGTDFEYSTLQRLDWLENTAKHFGPEERTLKEGLEFSIEEFEFFLVWREVFSRTNLEDTNLQLALVEGYGFWIHLRLIATDEGFAGDSNAEILNELKPKAQIVRNTPNINQYIRSVQSGLERLLRDPNEYLDAIINFHSQPTNGTLLQTPIQYVSENSRWECRLKRKGWKIVVLETNQFHDLNKYEKSILVQEGVHRTNKKIICSFYRDDNEKIILEPESSMKLMAILEKKLLKKIGELIEERKNEGRNETSLSELIKLFKDTGVPYAEKSVIETIGRITNLYKVNKYYVIDPKKPHSPPPPEYQELDGWKEVFSSSWQQNRIMIPLDPSMFASYLEKFDSMLKLDSKMTLRKYRNMIRNDFEDVNTSGAFYIYWALKETERYNQEWQDLPIKKLDCTKSEFSNNVEGSVLALCGRFPHSINNEVVHLYFRDVSDAFRNGTE